MTSQQALPFPFNSRAVDDAHLDLVMDELREVIGSPECPHKDVVYDRDIPKSSLSMALSRTDTSGHDVPLRVFLYAVRRARTDKLAALVANIRDRDLCQRALTAEQRLAKLEAAVRAHGSVGAAILDEAGLK